MRSSKPTALATWMLEHLLLGDRNEALAGDLLEEFQRRRSVVWYWRQVLGPILVSLSNELRAEWVTVCTIVFAAVCAYGLYVLSHVDVGPGARYVLLLFPPSPPCGKERTKSTHWQLRVHSGFCFLSRTSGRGIGTWASGCPGMGYC